MSAIAVLPHETSSEDVAMIERMMRDAEIAHISRCIAAEKR